MHQEEKSFDTPPKKEFERLAGWSPAGKLAAGAHHQRGGLNLWSARNYAANNDSLLLAQQAMHRVYLNDSLLTDVPWRFYEHPLREQQGLLYDLPVYDLPRGRYILRFERYRLNDADSLYWKTWAEVSFLR